jgi:hypothetical protein
MLNVLQRTTQRIHPRLKSNAFDQSKAKAQTSITHVISVSHPDILAPLPCAHQNGLSVCLSSTALRQNRLLSLFHASERASERILSFAAHVLAYLFLLSGSHTVYTQSIKDICLSRLETNKQIIQHLIQKSEPRKNTQKQNPSSRRSHVLPGSFANRPLVPSPAERN